MKVYLKAVEDEDFLTICGYYVEEESLYVETVSLRIWFDDDGYLFVNGEAEVGTRFLRRGPPAINPKVVEAGYWKEVSRYQRAHLRLSFGIVPYPRWPKDMEAGCGRTVTRYLRDHREPSFGIVPRRELHKFLPDRE